MVTVPPILTHEREDDAIARIKNYYEAMTKHSRPAFTGSRFDDFLPEENPRDRFTAADLLATGLLSVHVPADGIVQMLANEERAQELNSLLAKLPEDVDLVDLSDRAFAKLLDDPESPGHKLWVMLRHKDTKKLLGIGPTLTSKLLARKRPRLIPIWDSKIGTQLGLEDSGGHWQTMRELLTQDNGELVDRLTTIRRASGQEGRISLLRTFDVAVWHAEKYSEWTASDTAPALADEEDPTVGETDEERVNS